ncbi:M23 family metallopeptidase [Cellulomonas shaoxiangyii]|uniref:M23 family metallopeptidase n=2 Tax=Cellulomonas shaoxiangyii TaxID=2566013 RepID=A0A4P7SM76_9CELL|nr:M23 family metallopeptidase [Cellulomonas shaoxiangyii]TGY81778.1 M23 family metallopeptidase [Cellulomonas shaoxiangyii]
MPRRREPRRRGRERAGALVSAVALALAGAAAAAQPSAAGVGAPPAPSAYRAPVHPPVLARAFVAPPEPWAAGHRGVDLLAAAGADVVSPADGIVSFTGPVAGRGVVTVLHPDGRRSSVEPVVPHVTAGDPVRAGERLGTVGEGGHCAGTCVHWGVREGDRYVDPWSLLAGAGPVVLLPVR